MAAAKVIGWKIYFDDGSTYSSKQGRWEDAPVEGVEVVNIYFEDGFIYHWWGNEFYSLEGGVFRVYHLEHMGTGHFEKQRDAGSVKRGRSMDNRRFEVVKAKAWGDNQL